MGASSPVSVHLYAPCCTSCGKKKDFILWFNVEIHSLSEFLKFTETIDRGEVIFSAPCFPRLFLSTLAM